MAKESTEKKPFFDVAYLCKNTLFCVLATGVLLLVGALFAVYFSVAERTIELLVMILTAICIFLGGFRGARHTGRQGLAQGMIFGLVYMTILTLTGMIVCQSWSVDQSGWISILIGILCGAVGGMLGVNAKSKGKRKR